MDISLFLGEIKDLLANNSDFLSHELGWIAEGKGNMARAALRWILDNLNIT